MESTLFTDLAVSEQASVSGGSSENRGNIAVIVPIAVQTAVPIAVSVYGDASSKSVQFSTIDTNTLVSKYVKH